MSDIAEIIKTNKSSVSRELKRNSDGRNGEYRAELAQNKCERRHREKNKKKTFIDDVRSFVELYLKQDYSPEQITGYAARIDQPCVSPERIYQYVWKDKKMEGRSTYI